DGTTTEAGGTAKGPGTGGPRVSGAAGGPRPGQLAPDGPCEVAGEPSVRRLRQAFGRQWTVLAAAALVPRPDPAPFPGPGGPDVCLRRIVPPGAPVQPGDVIDTDGVLR